MVPQSTHASKIHSCIGTHAFKIHACIPTHASKIHSCIPTYAFKIHASIPTHASKIHHHVAKYPPAKALQWHAACSKKIMRNVVRRQIKKISYTLKLRLFIKQI